MSEKNSENEKILQIRNNRIKLISDYKKENDTGTLTPEKQRGYIEWLIKNTQAARALNGLKTGEEKLLGKGGRARFLRSFERQAKKDLEIEG